jgi:hypothetical protein
MHPHRLLHGIYFIYVLTKKRTTMINIIIMTVEFIGIIVLSFLPEKYDNLKLGVLLCLVWLECRMLNIISSKIEKDKEE